MADLVQINSAGVQVAYGDEPKAQINSAGVQVAYGDEPKAQVDSVGLNVAYSTKLVLGPAGISSSESFGAPTIEGVSAQQVLPTGLSSGEALGTPELIPGAVTLQPAGIDSEESFGLPEAQPGAVSLQPVGISGAESLGSPQVVPGPVVLEPAGIADAELASAIALANDLKAKFRAHGPDELEHTTNPDIYFMYPIAAPDAEDLTTLLALTTELLGAYYDHEFDAEQISDWVFHAGQESEDHSVVSIDPPINLQECIARLIDLRAKYNAHDADDSAHGTHSSHQTEAELQFGDPTIIPVVQPGAIPTAESFGTPAVIPGTVQVLPEGIVSGEALSTPTVVVQVLPASIASQEAVGSPTVTAGAVLLQPEGIASQESFGSPMVEPGAVNLEPAPIVTGEVIGSPRVLPGQVILQPEGIAGEEELGVPGLIPGQVEVAPAGVVSGEGLGVPRLIWNQSVAVQGIPSAEAMGTLLVLAGRQKVPELVLEVGSLLIELEFGMADMDLYDFPLEAVANG